MDLPQTQTTQAERQALARYAAGCKALVEIGVFEGRTTKVLADAARKEATVFGVDPFFTGRLGVSWGRLIAQSYNSSEIQHGLVRLVRSKSTQVGNEVPHCVDFVFIDADHGYESVKADWNFWTDRLAPSGLVVLHDVIVPAYNPRVAELGSHKFFYDIILHDTRFVIIDRVDSLVVLRKESA